MTSGDNIEEEEEELQLYQALNEEDKDSGNGSVNEFHALLSLGAGCEDSTSAVVVHNHSSHCRKQQQQQQHHIQLLEQQHKSPSIVTAEATF